MLGINAGLYGLVGLAVGVLLHHAGCRLLQRRAGQPDLSLEPMPGLPPSRWLAVTTGAGFAILWLRFGPSWQTVLISVYFSVFVLIFALDIAQRWVPNVLLLPAAILALLASALSGRPPLSSALLGGAVGFMWFYLIAMAYRGALGAGDVKLAGLIGLVTGFPGVLMALAVGILVGGGVAGLLLVSGKKRRKSYIPYAPFLVSGAVYTLVFGAQHMPVFSSLVGW